MKGERVGTVEQKYCPPTVNTDKGAAEVLSEDGDNAQRNLLGVGAGLIGSLFDKVYWAAWTEDTAPPYVRYPAPTLSGSCALSAGALGFLKRSGRSLLGKIGSFGDFLLQLALLV